MDFLEKQFLEQLSATIDEQNNTVLVSEVPFTPEQILRTDPDGYKEAFRRWKYEDWLPTKLQLADEILNLDNNKERYRYLIEALGRDNVTPFIGSGMSSPSGKPLWKSFLEKMCEISTSDRNTFARLLQEGRYEDAASLILSNMPPQLFNEQLEHTFRVKSPEEINGAIRYIPLVFKRTVVTLNFDNLLEVLFDSIGNRFNPIVAGERIRHFRNFDSTNHCLLKLHGDYAEPDSRVLTNEEFEASYAPDSTIRENLSLLFRTRKLLFLGCSLENDRTSNLFEELVATDTNAIRHCALLRLPEPERKLEREHCLARRNIFPIWYDGGHDESIEALLVKILNDLNALEN